VIESRRKNAMLDLSLFRKPSFTGVSIVAFTLSAGMFAMFLYLTLYMQGTLGYSPKLMHGVTGKGLNDYDAICRTLAVAGYAGWVSIEDGMNGMAEMAESLAFLRHLRPADWDRAGVHPTRGRLTMRDFVGLMAEHDANHLDQLKRALDGKP